MTEDDLLSSKCGERADSVVEKEKRERKEDDDSDVGSMDADGHR